jgi:hypothetical protein
MKKMAMCSAPLLLGLMAGCAAKQPPPPPEPVSIDPVHQERCYVMDRAQQEQAGYVMLEEGHQFYFQPDCEVHRYVGDDAEPDAKPVAEEEEKTPAKAKTTPAWLSVSDDEAAPSCIYDKMTAGQPGLEPCPWDDEEGKWVK